MGAIKIRRAGDRGRPLRRELPADGASGPGPFAWILCPFYGAVRRQHLTHAVIGSLLPARLVINQIEYETDSGGGCRKLKDSSTE